MYLVGCLFSPVNALYFYMDGTSQKCFYEELPKDTLVVGTTPTDLN
jgi:p24 family protein alpha